MTTNQLSSKKSNQNKGVVIPGSEFDPSTVTFSKPNMDENLGSKFIYPRANIDGKETVRSVKQGSKIVVQILKPPTSDKGPRVTTKLSFAFRFLVFLPYI